MVTVGRIINCTGPETDVAKSSNVLLRALYNSGLVLREPLGLGIQALPSGQVIQGDGTASTSLFAVGNLMKGVLWESTAVPELRVSASQIADQILVTRSAINQTHTAN
jgi:uncharacterized NAD(P)/FAD-binding protein YdhS